MPEDRERLLKLEILTTGQEKRLNRLEDAVNMLVEQAKQTKYAIFGGITVLLSQQLGFIEVIKKGLGLG